MAGGAKVKVRKVSLAVKHSPARRKISKPSNTPSAMMSLKTLPPFQWSGEKSSSTSSNNKSNGNDNSLMPPPPPPPPVVAMSFKNSGARKLLAQYAQVRQNYLDCLHSKL